MGTDLKRPGREVAGLNHLGLFGLKWRLPHAAVLLVAAEKSTTKLIVLTKRDTMVAYRSQTGESELQDMLFRLLCGNQTIQEPAMHLKLGLLTTYSRMPRTIIMTAYMEGAKG